MRSKILTGILALIFLLSGMAMAGQLPEEGIPEYDFEGATLKFSNYLTTWYFNWEEGKDLARLKEVENRFNVNIEFVTQNWKQEMQNLGQKIMAGEQVYDIYLTTSGRILKYSSPEFFYDMNKVVDDDLFQKMPEVGPVHKDQQFYIKDKLLGVNQPGARCLFNAMLWNKDFFERNGLPDLYELVENKEWTYETFFEIAKKATQDTDGDGEPDRWGVGQVHPFSPRYFVDLPLRPTTNNAAPVKYIDGKYTFTADQPNFIEVLKNNLKLYNSNFIYPAENVHEAEKPWREGKIAMFMNYPMGWIFTGMGGDEITMEDDWGIIPRPMGPKADDYNVSSDMTHIFAMPVNIVEHRDPEAVWEVVKALYQLSEPYIDKEKYEKEYWENFDVAPVRDYKSIQNYRKMINNVNMTLPWGFIINDSYNQTLIKDPIATQEKTPAAAMKEIKQQAQSRLDEFFDQLK